MAQRLRIPLGKDGAWLAATIRWETTPDDGSREQLECDLGEFASACHSVKEIEPPAKVGEELFNLAGRTAFLLARVAVSDPSAATVAVSTLRIGRQFWKLLDRDELGGVKKRCPELGAACDRLRERLRELEIAELELEIREPRERRGPQMDERER